MKKIILTLVLCSLGVGKADANLDAADYNA